VGDAALQWQAYNGLAKCIKDHMVHHNKPNALSSLWKLIQAIYARYWEWHGEVSRETYNSKSSRSSGNKSKPKTDVAKSDHKSGKSSWSKQKNNSDSTQGNTSEPKEPTPNLASKLSKDSELTPQECQHQLHNNLCLLCGIYRHIAKDFSKSSW